MNTLRMNAQHARDHDEKKHGSRWVLVVGIAVVVVATLVVGGLYLRSRHHARQERDARGQEQAKGPHVSFVKVEVSSDKRSVTVPAEVKPFESATLYAKVAGYVKSIKVERGQRVKKGDVLAEVESPETAQNLEAARSDAEQKHIMADRMRVLSGPGVVSKSDLDLAVNDEQRAKAAFASAAATQGYATIRAPFDGIVTARYVDNGSLLPAATSSTQSAQPVVDVATIDTMRIFAYVGQDVAPFLHEGDTATLWQDESGARRIPAKVSHTTGSLDQRTRTMQVEIDLDNREWKLVPGSFVHVKFDMLVPPSPAVPNDALIVKDGKMNVAVIDGNKLHFKQVELGPNDGKTTRIMSGLQGGESVGVNVPIEVGEDATVQALPRTPDKEQPPRPGEAVAPKEGDKPNRVENVDAGK